MVKALAPEKKAYALFLKEHTSYSMSQIALKTGISKTSVFRAGKPKIKRKTRRPCGRPRKLNEREVRLVIRTFKELRKEKTNVTAREVLVMSGLAGKVCVRTLSNILHKNGYFYLQARKKGLLTENDKKKRRVYARATKKNILKREPDFFTNGVSFYLDGVSFVHKTNPCDVASEPKSRVWRRKGEGLQITAKGSKSLAGGRRVHIMVAIAFGKGVILKHVYEKMDGQYFAKIINEDFNLCIAKAGPKNNGKRIIVMDNDPCQNSKVAINALDRKECQLHKIPARSPDLNPIENVFNLVKKS